MSKSPRDPRQPFGSSAMPSGIPQPELWSPPPRKPVWPWMVGLVAALAAVVVIVALWPAREPEVLVDQPVASAFPSPSVTGNAIPYENNGTGMFIVENHTWTEDTLEVTFTVTSDGTNYFQVFAFSNETRQSFQPVDEPIIEVKEGEPVTTSVQFTMPAGDATFVLATSGERAIAALPIPGP